MRLRYAWNWRPRTLLAAKLLLAWLALMLAFLTVSYVTKSGGHLPSPAPRLSQR